MLVFAPLDLVRVELIIYTYTHTHTLAQAPVVRSFQPFFSALEHH